MNLRRQFIRKSIEYYVAHGCDESEARRHANADLRWWEKELKKVFEKTCTFRTKSVV